MREANAQVLSTCAALPPPLDDQLTTHPFYYKPLLRRRKIQPCTSPGKPSHP